MTFHPSHVHVATDHAAFELKEYLVKELRAAGYQVVDHGATSYDAEDDYPDFCIPCAQAVVAEPGSLGIVCGGSGNGEQIAANKVAGIRAALVYNAEMARLAREHNDANVISLGGRMQSVEDAWEWVKVFLTTPFSGVERHQRRIEKLAHWESAGALS
ncbi:ribose-5-phosphate isomerase [Acidipropionibacterium jensenii]|uniref:ribose-5-phosphate isomerase n=1 Tax=Acidipropionibacterium jensenii TaxID=1749 RepID=UPI000BC2F0EF|nr:ribose-5-phosphate isomerase [Acidipropionibacterium jensenii]AZZ42509.1 ribose-5-phosphate isomerase [Acidipropionibacterium jensenii]